MSRKIFSLILAIVTVFTMMTAAYAENTVTITDMTGREITFSEPVTRMVVLTAADCEIVYALGAGDTVIGRGEYCDYPAEVLDVAVVNSGTETNIEQVLALEPQVVLMSTMDQSEEQIVALENAGVKVVASNADDIQGVYYCIEMIGAMLGKDAEAEAMVNEMKATFDKIAADAASSEAAGKRVYLEVSPLQWGLWAGCKGTFMDEIITMCGLTNIFGDIEGWQQVSEEQVIERNPDYIVSTTMYFGEGPMPVEEIMGRTGWENISAVVSGNVFNADNNEVTRPGPRLTNAAVSLYNFFNGINVEAE
ncbi:MAG: ABC transporter substrate-binding protein [Clostridia bacterium]|nr:ABC transporter substrate-binding protein [Clostridia bacterium]